MSKRVTIACIFLSIAGSTLAQSPGLLKFDAISVKENKSGDTRVANNLNQPGGRFVATNFPLGLLIALIYQVPTQAERTGWPEWINQTRYDIEAVTERNPSREEKIQMVKAVLADRFSLAVHRHDQELPVYALKVVRDGKLGPQLTPHTDDSKCRNPQTTVPQPPPQGGAPPVPVCGGFNGAPAQGRLNGQKVTMAQLVTFLSQPSGRYVLDQTGLTGAFDLTLQYQPQQSSLGPDAAATDVSGPPSIFTAIQEQLGLRLAAQTGPVPVLVIDHVEMPSEN